MEREVIDLYLDDIIPNRFQPREVFNEPALRELSDSIKSHGVIQPIIVRKIGDKYEIIAGERRYKASAMAGLTKIPAIIRNLDDKETSKVALLENLQRKDLTPIEEARTYQKILELDSMTQEELGRNMGKSQASIANKMRLLSLPDEVQEALLRDQISERHARSLLNLDNSEEQIATLHRIINNRMTVRELDHEIKVLKGIVEEPQVEEVKPIDNNHQFTQQSPIPEFQPVVEEPQSGSQPVVIPSINATNNTSTIDFSVTEKDSLPSFDIFENKSQTPVSKPVEPFNITPPVEPEKKTYTIEELLDDDELYSLKDAVTEIKNSIESIKKKGFLVKMDEMDFESTYQIIIQIDKNN